MVVKIKTFSRTAVVLDETASETMMAAVEYSSNEFLASLDKNNVLDVRMEWSSLGKYDNMSIYQATIIYLE